jgi:GNAT superfamily N-acetyltransferase
MAGPTIQIRLASTEDAPLVRELRVAVAEHLTREHGTGHWSQVGSVETIQDSAAAQILFVVEQGGELIGTFRLTDKKEAWYRASWFARPEAQAAYLRAMAIRPDDQRKGIGRFVMDWMEQRVQRKGLAALRFDAYDSKAGAGEFYRKCGYTHVHSGEFNGVALEYYEKTFT